MATSAISREFPNCEYVIAEHARIDLPIGSLPALAASVQMNEIVRWMDFSSLG
jgi:hypothetical protein